MKKISIVVLGICLVIAGFSSCKKTKNASVKDNLVGKWKPTKGGADANSNGVLDASEETTDTMDQYVRIIFNANGTASITLNDVPFGMLNWSLEHSDTYVKTTDTSFGGGTTYLRIDNLTSSSMTLRDTTGGTTEWSVFAKQ